MLLNTRARNRICTLAAALALLAGCAVPAGDDRASERVAAPAADGTPRVACDDAGAIRDALLARINAARAEARMCGDHSMAASPAVTWSPRLARAGAAHAADLARNDFVGHAGSDGLRVDARVERAGYDWRAVGENVAAGAPTVDRTVGQWLTSPGHCRNLMNRDYTAIGGACRAAPDSRYGIYWVLVLGDPLPSEDD